MRLVIREIAKSTIVRIENAQVNTSVEILDRIAGVVDKDLKMSIVYIVRILMNLTSTVNTRLMTKF